MDTIRREFDSVCSISGYCIEESEIEEVIVLFLFSVFLTLSSLRQIQLRDLFGRNSEYYNLKDDVFDITLLYIYGVILLVLSFAAIKWNYDVLQIDIIFYHILLGITALYVRDSPSGGILFTCLSYSSWYGLFRLFLANPIEENFWVMIQPQWLSALIAFTAPILIANLKYPSFIQGNLASVTYGTVIFGLLIACNTIFVFIDVFIIYLNIFPDYGARLSKEVNFRLYGTSFTVIQRVYYFGTMIILQLLCIQLPHIFFNRDNLDEQLQIRYEIQKNLRKSSNIQQKKQTTTDIEEILHNINLKHNIQTNKMKSKPGSDIPIPKTSKEGEVDSDTTKLDTSKEGQSSPDIPIPGTSEEYQDLPEDCIEITAEDAIKLQERGLYNSNDQSDHTLHQENKNIKEDDVLIDADVSTTTLRQRIKTVK